jgi:BlaI family penicillinase repressor
MADRPEISDSEWQIMQVVWKEQPVTAATIVKQLAAENDWSPATIRTFLHRLVKKGVLNFQQDGNRYLYRAAFTKAKTIKQASRSFLTTVFGGETGPLLTHFVKSAKLSAEQIEELKQLLEEKDPK